MTRMFTNLGSTLRKTLIGRKAVLAAAIAATMAGPMIPAGAFAGGRYHDARDDDDRGRRYEHHDERSESHDRSSDTRVNFDIRFGTDPFCRPERYEERVTRVWVEPVYRTVCDRVWVEPVYRTNCDRVWVEPAYREDCTQVWVPERYEVREHVEWRRGHRVVVRDRVCVERGHYETRRTRVCVREGHWETVEHRVLVCEGHWQNVERQELACAGHWEDRVERVRVSDASYHSSSALEIVASLIR